MFRKIAYLLVVTVFLSCLYPCVWAEETPNAEQTEILAEESAEETIKEPVFIADLVGAAEGAASEKEEILEERIAIFKAINPDALIYEDVDAQITRADFLVLLSQLVAGSGFKSYTGFSDVDTDNTILCESLGYAINEKIVSPSDKFRPDDGITYQEMIKMAVSAAGYDILAQKNGGWPSGYLKVAQQIKLSAAIEVSDKKASAKDAYTLLYNLLTVDLLEQNVISEDDVYEIEKGKNILEARYDIHIAEGVVTADDISGLTDINRAEKGGNIKIGTLSFVNKTGKSLLGYRVRGFYRDNDGIYELISIRKFKNAEAFVPKIAEVSGLTLVSEEADGETEEYELYKGYSVIVNGEASPSTSIKMLAGRSDVTVKLIDNDNDGNFDVANVSVWEYMHIGKLDSVNKILYDSNVPDSALDLSNKNLTLKIYDCIDGAVTKAEFDNLAVGNVLTYTISANNKIVTIFRGNENVIGTIGALDKENGNITIGDKEYELSVYAKDKFEFISLGQDATAHFDASGKIVVLSGSDASFSYGWIIGSYQKRAMGDITIKMFTQSGKMQVFTVAENLYIDNVSKTAEDLYQLEVGLGDDRLVKYALDAEGNLKSVDFPAPYVDDGTLPFAKNYEPRDSFILYYDASYSKTSSGNFDNNFQTDKNTIFFSIPETDRSNEELYLIKSFNNFRNGYTTVIKAYDISHGSVPNVCLLFSDQANINNDKYTGSEVVLEVVAGIDDEGEERKIIKTYNGTDYKKYYAHSSAETDVDKLVPGDIVRLSVYNDEIYQVTIDYSYNTNSIATAVDNLSGDVSFVKGYVYSYGKSLLHLWRPAVSVTDTDIKLANIITMDFGLQDAIFVDVYKDKNGNIKKVMAEYRPISELKDYLHSGTEASFMVFRQSEGADVSNGRWVFRDKIR